MFYQHPNIKANLFMGEIYLADAPPWNYIPVWFAITAPPLALAAIGYVAVCWQGVLRSLAALRDHEVRFRIMLPGCVVLPMAVVIALQSNIYQGWRQMYFLWGPFCLLEAVGLQYIANIGVSEVFGREDLVLDPFSGSGTTAYAAQILDRRAVGIEVHKPYIEDAIAKRFAHQPLCAVAGN